MLLPAELEAAGSDSARFSEHLAWLTGYFVWSPEINSVPVLYIAVPAGLAGWRQEHMPRQGV
jgi:hypothetical protein